MKTKMKMCWLLLALAVGSLTAALPKSAYVSMQQNAPESLQVLLKSVSTTKEEDRRSTQTHFIAQAEVLSVKRSKSGLKAGDVITISYTRRINKQREPGPAANPVIRKGQKSPAYLRAVPGGKSYELAAGAFSFKTVTIKAR